LIGLIPDAVGADVAGMYADALTKDTPSGL